MVVNAGGKVLTPNASGVYTISSVYVDTTITVTGLVFIESATVFGYSNYFDEYNVNLGLQINGFF